MHMCVCVPPSPSSPPISSTAEWEVSLMTLFREFGDTWNPTPGNKLYEREQLLSRKVAEVGLELRTSTLTD